MDLIVFEPGQIPYQTDTLAALPENGFVWLDFIRDLEPDWAERVKRFPWHPGDIHERHVRDSLNVAHPPYFDAMPGYEMLIFRGFCSENAQSYTATRPVVFYLFEHCLISVRSVSTHSLNQVREQLVGRASRVPTRMEGLLYLLLNTMVERFLFLREPLSAQLDHWRNVLLQTDNAFAEWHKLMDHRSELRKLETLCEQQVDAFTSWREETRFQIDEHLAVRFKDLLEHLYRVLHHVQSLQSEIDFLIQLQFSAAAQRTNSVVGILTVLSAVFLPLNLVAGMFGMNLAGIPFNEHPLGFYLVACGMLLLAAVLLALFRRKRWM